jgi:hypothetical protein
VAVLSTLTSLDVNVILNQRLDLASLSAGATAKTEPSFDPVTGAPVAAQDERIVRTLSGREIRAELVVSASSCVLPNVTVAH